MKKIDVYQAVDNGSVPEELWKAGDIVTRDGNDEHEILEINEPRDLISVVCVKEPPIYEGSDEPWTKLGETEDNLTRRYDFVRPGKNT